MIKPLFTINDWNLLSCGTDLSTPQAGDSSWAPGARAALEQAQN